MANVVVTMNVMPESVEIDLNSLKGEVEKKVKGWVGDNACRMEEQAVAFGLKMLKVVFVMDEAKGATDPLEEQVRSLEGVQSAEAVDVRRAVG